MSFPDFYRMWDYSKPAETEVKFRELLSDESKIPDDAYRSELLTQIARTLGLQQRFDEALITLQQAEDISDPSMIRTQALLSLERGRVFNSSNRQSESLPYFNDALDWCTSNGLENLAVDAAHMLGIADQENSLSWNERAIAMAEGASDPNAKAWLGSLYNNTGWSYANLKRYQDALEMFKKHEQFRIEQKNDVQVSIAQWCIAKMLRLMNKPHESLEIQMELLKRPENNDGTHGGFVHEEIAECLYALDRREEAKPHFLRAWNLLKDDIWLARDEKERLERLKDLSGEW